MIHLQAFLSFEAPLYHITSGLVKPSPLQEWFQYDALVPRFTDRKQAFHSPIVSQI